MALSIDVRREVLFAPSQHITPWALNPIYTSTQGNGMVMSVVEHDGHGLGANRYQEWTATWRRFRSSNGGATWHPTDIPLFIPITAIHKATHVGYQGAWAYWLEPQSGRVIGFHSTPKFSDDFQHTRSRFFYTVSEDGACSWDTPRRIVHSGDGCDEHNWMPGFDPQRHIASFDQPHPVTLPDGTLVFGFTVKTPRYMTRFFRGRWDESAAAMTWQSSDPISVPPDVSSTGPCEPDLLSLGGQRLLTTMRTQGIPARKVPTTRQCSISEDGGRTWTKPEPLKYDDGTPVWVPAAISVFQRDPATGRVFWFANIQSEPVYGQIPRYPLTMAELDTRRLCILKDSVTVIQALPPGAPQAGDPKKGELGRRYSNFGHYVDRTTGEFVLLVAEEPRQTWDDYWSDCIRFRIKLRK
jgi:hypothetical protein